MITRLRGLVLIVMMGVILAGVGNIIAQSEGAGGERCLPEITQVENSLSVAAQISRETDKIEDNPEDIEALLRRANLNRSIGSYDRALEDYERILEIDSDYTANEFKCNHAFTYVMLASTYFQQGDNETGLDTLDLALKADPTLPTYAPYYQILGELHVMQQEYDEAIEDFTHSIEAQGLPRSYLSRARVYLQQGEIEQALQDLSMAIDLDATDMDARYTRGAVLISLGEYDTAMEDIEAVLDEYPTFPLGYFQKARVFIGMGNLDKALDNLALALALDPSLTDGYLFRADLYLSQGQLDEALADYSAALEVDSSLVDAYVGRANIYIQQEDYDAALDNYSQLIELDPSNALSYDLRATVYVQAGDNDAALEDYNHAIELDPSATSYSNRAYGYDEMGDHEAAIEDFTKAIALDPTNPSGYLVRGASHARAGDTEEAADDYFAWINGNEQETVEGDAIEIGDTRTIDMTKGRVYRIPFEGRLGQTISITADTAEGSSNDPLVVLLDEDEQPLVSDDDGGEGFNSLIDSYRLPATGTYWIVVSHAGGGSEGEVDVALSRAE